MNIQLNQRLLRIRVTHRVKNKRLHVALRINRGKNSIRPKMLQQVLHERLVTLKHLSKLRVSSLRRVRHMLTPARIIDKRLSLHRLTKKRDRLLNIRRHLLRLLRNPTLAMCRQRLRTHRLNHVHNRLVDMLLLRLGIRGIQVHQLEHLQQLIALLTRARRQRRHNLAHRKIRQRKKP